MGLSLPGLASGIDSAAIIAATMDVERLPQTQLKSKVTSMTDYTSVLKTINGQVASLFTTADAQTKPGAYELFTATSSSPAVKVTAAAGANSADLDITVTALASKHVAVTAGMDKWSENPPVLTFSKGGTDVTVTADSDSLDDVVKAVNASDAGVTATKVSAGDGTFRIQFSSKESGSAQSFDVKDSSGTTVFGAGSAVIKKGADASITLFAGTDAEQVVTSTSNSFDAVLPGVSITATAVTDGPVGINVTKDTKAVSDKANRLVDDLNTVFSYIKLKSTVSSTTGGTGEGVVTSGVLTSDSMTRAVSQALMDAGTAPVDGRSPSEIGIEITRDGLITYNPEKFEAAMAADPKGTEKMLTTIAERVASAAKTASDKYDGTITAKINGQDTVLRTLNDQITTWDTRLSQREAALAAQYARLEVSMSNLNSILAGLQSAISSLPTPESSSK